MLNPRSIINLTGLLLLPSLACGPSLRLVHQNDEAFERCYAMEHRQGTNLPEKRHQCWSTWLDKHTLGQPPEKIRFAEQRKAHSIESESSSLIEQSDGESATDAGLMPSQHAGSAPHNDSISPTSSSASSTPHRFSAPGCLGRCRDARDLCDAECSEENKACRTACRSEYRICLRACPFQDDTTKRKRRWEKNYPQ